VPQAASDSALGHALSHDEEWVASVKEDTSFGHGLNYHHPSAGDLGYQFYMPPGAFFCTPSTIGCEAALPSKAKSGTSKPVAIARRYRLDSRGHFLLSGQGSRWLAAGITSLY